MTTKKIVHLAAPYLSTSPFSASGTLKIGWRPLQTTQEPLNNPNCPPKSRFFITSQPQNGNFSPSQWEKEVHLVPPSPSFNPFLCGPHPQHTVVTPSTHANNVLSLGRTGGGGEGGGALFTMTTKKKILHLAPPYPLTTPFSASGTLTIGWRPLQPTRQPPNNTTCTRETRFFVTFYPQNRNFYHDKGIHSTPCATLPFYNPFLRIQHSQNRMAGHRSHPETSEQSKLYPKIMIFRDFSPPKRQFFTITNVKTSTSCPP